MQLPKSFTTVTPLSKILAITLFVSLPFVSFYLGTKYQIPSELVSQEIKPIPSVILPAQTTTTKPNGPQYINFIDSMISLEIPDNWITTVKQGVPEGGIPPRTYSFYEKDNSNPQLSYPVGLQIDTGQGEIYEVYRDQYSQCWNKNNALEGKPNITKININGYLGERCDAYMPYIGEFIEILAKKGNNFLYLSTITKNDYYSGNKQIFDINKIIESIRLTD